MMDIQNVQVFAAALVLAAGVACSKPAEKTEPPAAPAAETNKGLTAKIDPTRLAKAKITPGDGLKPKAAPVLDGAKKKLATSRTAQRLRMQIVRYCHKSKIQELPDQIDAFLNPQDGGAPAFSYAQLKDGWGNDFVYTKKDKTKFEWRSVGPDGKWGGEDDLVLGGEIGLTLDTKPGKRPSPELTKQQLKLNPQQQKKLRELLNKRKLKNEQAPPKE